MNMYRNIFIGGLSISFLGGCSFMPSTGPHASFILDKKKNSIPVEKITEETAASLWQQALQDKKDAVEASLVALRDVRPERLKISTGDVVNVTLWVQASQSDSALGNVPQPRKMGEYTVSMRGKVNLPYVGEVFVRGMDLQQAGKKIAGRYEQTRLFPQAEASLEISENKAQSIVVMGAVNKPSVINWEEAGVNISEAVAGAGGFKVFDPSKQGSDLSVNDVEVLRKGNSYKVPLSIALSNAVPLQPGDRLILQHTPVVRALGLGAGWTSPTAMAFDEMPSLARALSSSGGMNPGIAQGRAIFVLKQKTRMIYYVDFDKVEGMKAAQNFPIENQDVIYIPSARSVTLQQAVNIIMSIGYPAAMGAAIK